ncbi:hypothetical protein [Bifidobacterium crudilactis]|uniref:hypothetical protein n=1 Tax=Bifidobacterium crudilactis TaxID=327277 RepID=UPI002354C944|nr:hypothetical protein [Bifidobacterium crudilactis]MCI1869033.1 hypothetical protein [Bifidobacterium crudilactis]
MRIRNNNQGHRSSCLLLGALLAVGLAFGGMVAPVASAATSDVAVNESNFPDAVFRGYVSEHFDTDANGSLSADEISNAQSVHVSEYLDDSHKFHSVQGIEYFTELTNLFIPGAYVSELDVSHNPQLVEVNVYNNELTGLDLSANTHVTTLNVSGNPLVALKLGASVSGLTIGYLDYAKGFFGDDSTFDLKSLVPWFDASKVSGFSGDNGETLEGSVVTGLTRDVYAGDGLLTRRVHFTYDAGHGASVNANISLTQVTIADSDDIKVSNPRVEDVGSHTVGLKVDYEISQELWDWVDKVCLSSSFSRVFLASVHPGMTTGWDPGSTNLWDCTSGVDDADLSQDSALERARIYAVHSDTENSERWYPLEEGSKWTVNYQSFSRSSDDFAKDTLASRTGTMSTTLGGFLDNTKYGNWLYNETGEQLQPHTITSCKGGGACGASTEGVTNLWSLPAYSLLGLFDGYTSAQFSELYKDKNAWPTLSKTDPASYQYAGLVLFTKDGRIIKQNTNDAALIPEFTTQSVTPLDEGELNDGNKGDIEGGNNNTANPDSPYRVYINKLVDSCKALVDEGLYCYWAGYIYSTPTRLLTPDGQNHLLVQKDNNGKYYVNVQLPASYSGAHKIALYDQEGNIQGWTDFTIGKSAATGKNDSTAAKGSNVPGKRLASTGSSVSVIALVSFIVLATGATFVTARKKMTK